MTADNLNKKRYSKADVQTVLQTAEGQQLIQILQAEGGEKMKEIAGLIKAGSYEKAIAMLKPMVETEKTQQLIRQIDQKIG